MALAQAGGSEKSCVHVSMYLETPQVEFDMNSPTPENGSASS